MPLPIVKTAIEAGYTLSKFPVTTIVRHFWPRRTYYTTGGNMKALRGTRELVICAAREARRVFRTAGSKPNGLCATPPEAVMRRRDLCK